MSIKTGLTFRFWGVRGSIPTPGPTTVRYGGNTSCVEVVADGHRVVLDAGSGLRALGAALLEAGEPVEMDLVLSHMHWDHIQGFPFFAPAYQPGHSVRVWAAGDDAAHVEASLGGQMRAPYFPVPLTVMRAALSFHTLSAQQALGPLTLRTAPLKHPGGCLGLRLDFAGRALVYATDTEHSDTLDPNLVALASGVDALIYDAMYTTEVYEASKRGFGHSTMAEGIRVARAAGVKRLYFFHHDPAHDDAFLDRCLRWAREETAQDPFEVFMAQEGLEVNL